VNISVVILTLNNANTVEETIQSIMPSYNVGFVNEIVVVDGHSTDETLNIVGKFPVKIIIVENRSIAFAREVGWRNSNGEIIVFLDSDAFISEGFFPEVLNFFSDDKVGIVGCYAKAVVSNSLTRTTSQEWEFLSSLSNSSPTLFIRLYCWLHGAKPQNTPAGPCQIVRRICLEQTGGFPNYAHAEDIALSERIQTLGWKTLWWVKSPIFHHPRSNIGSMMRQSYRNGKLFAVWQIVVKDQSIAKLIINLHYSLNIISRLGAPIVGLILAIQFRNIRHLATYTLSRYSWLLGYIKIFIFLATNNSRRTNNYS
jgi:glycosyltransferase involved in cell wall biosynthesis